MRRELYAKGALCGPVGTMRRELYAALQSGVPTLVCFRKFDNDVFLSDLSTALNSIQFTINTNVNFSMWIKSFTSVLDKHAPIKSKRVKRKIQPEWFNNDIKEASKKKGCIS